MGEPIIIEGNQIAGFVLLQLKHKLKMEVDNPSGPKWRVSPAAQARQLIVQAGRPDPGRSKAKVYEALVAWMSELGIPK